MPPKETIDEKLTGFKKNKSGNFKEYLKQAKAATIEVMKKIKPKKATEEYEVIEGTETPEGVNQVYDERDFKGDFTEDTRRLFNPDDYSESNLKNTLPENLIIVNMGGICFVGRKISNEEGGGRIEFKTDSGNMTSAIVKTLDGIEAKDVYRTIRSKMFKSRHYEVGDNVFVHYGEKIEPYEKAVVLARIIGTENDNYILMIGKNRTITLPKAEVEKTTKQELKKLRNGNGELDDEVEILGLKNKGRGRRKEDAIVIQMEDIEPPIKE